MALLCYYIRDCLKQMWTWLRSHFCSNVQNSTSKKGLIWQQRYDTLYVQWCNLLLRKWSSVCFPKLTWACRRTALGNETRIKRTNHSNVSAMSQRKQIIVYHKKQFPSHIKYSYINVFTCSLKVQIREMWLVTRGLPDEKIKHWSNQFKLSFRAK